MSTDMRRRFLAGLAAGIAFLLVAGAQVGAAGLGGTKHDFSRANPKNPFKQAKNSCDPCHQYLKIPLPTRIGGITVRLRGTAVCLSCHGEPGRPEVPKKVKCSFAAMHPVDVPLPNNPKFRKPEEMPGLIFYGEERLMGCTTCHDTHNGKGYPSFLRLHGENDALCVTCHNV
ncbi:MAG: cytochrome c3 family protein [Bacillota bacterium]|nr:cytochrome c3 family protein [Bacillota bacterium]